MKNLFVTFLLFFSLVPSIAAARSPIGTAKLFLEYYISLDSQVLSLVCPAGKDILRSQIEQRKRYETTALDGASLVNAMQFSSTQITPNKVLVKGVIANPYQEFSSTVIIHNGKWVVCDQ